MATEPEKLCLWCKHFYLDVGSPGYSEYTPGSDFEMDCRKNHWEYRGVSGTEDEYRACLISALVCPDYAFNETLVSIQPAYKKTI
jgi:hypothetical protein